MSTTLGYINPTASLPVPPLPPGERYQEQVPATFDIAERARLTMNALARATDPDLDHEMYFGVGLLYNPPFMRHGFDDWCDIKFWEGMSILRVVTGSTAYDEVYEAFLRAFVRSLGPDGALYLPLEGKGYGRQGCGLGAGGVIRADGSATDFANPEVTQVTNPFLCSRALTLLAWHGFVTGSDEHHEAIRRLVDRLRELAVFEDDFAWLPDCFYEPFARLEGEHEMPLGYVGEENAGRLIQGLVHAYRATGYDPALELAGRVVRYIRFHNRYFREDGSFDDVEDSKRFFFQHFHAHTIALVGMVDYAMAAADADVLGFIDRVFNWITAHPQVNTDLGFFPEGFLPDYPTTEVCGIADMITLGVKLSVAGAGSYWDLVDRWVRNQFAECQLTDPAWVHKAAAALPPTPIPDEERGMKTDVDVPERNVGAFAGWASANEFGPSIMHCCTGNASRTLYFLWEYAVESAAGGGSARVNFRGNLAHRLVDVYGYEPYEGRCVVRAKAALDGLSVRLPAWSPGSVRVTVNGADRAGAVEGRYVAVGPVAAGDVVELRYDLPVEDRPVAAGAKQYTATFKGTTVVSIDPPGVRGPLYERRDVLQGHAPVVSVERFVPEAVPTW